MAASRSCVPIGVVGPAELEVIDVLIALGRLSHFLGYETSRRTFLLSSVFVLACMVNVLARTGFESSLLRWGTPHGADVSQNCRFGPCGTGEPTVP